METRLDQIKEFIGELDHVEDIAVHPDGHIWVGGEAGQIYKIAPDAEENLYMSCYALNRTYRVSLLQEVQLRVDDREGHTLSNPTNIALGGPNFDQLYTSNLGRYHIHQIDFGVKGAPWACYQYFLKQS